MDCIQILPIILLYGKRRTLFFLVWVLTKDHTLHLIFMSFEQTVFVFHNFCIFEVFSPSLDCWPVYHKLRSLNSRYLFLTVLEDGKAESQCWQIWCGWEPLCGLQVAESAGMKQALSSLYEGINPIKELHFCDLITSRSPFLIPPHWGLGWQCMNFGGTQTCSL